MHGNGIGILAAYSGGIDGGADVDCECKDGLLDGGEAFVAG